MVRSKNKHHCVTLNFWRSCQKSKATIDVCKNSPCNSKSFEAGVFSGVLIFLELSVWLSSEIPRLDFGLLSWLSVMSDCFVPQGLWHFRFLYHTFLKLNSYSCPSNQWCYLTISFSVVSFLLPPLVLPSIRVVSSKSVLCIRWANYWSFSVCISSSKEYSGLILVSKGLIIVNGLSRRFFLCWERSQMGIERDDIGENH